MRAAIWAALCVIALTANAGAQDKAPQTTDELDARLAQAFTEGHVPGASVAVVENGQVVLLKGYGNADVAKKIPATPDTIFRAGSISKSLTGIAVMTLVEQRKLDLHAKLADLAPEVKFDNPWEATDPVRVAHLLEHTTGWPDISLRVYLQDGKNWTTLEGVQATSGEFVSRYRPGRFSVYNNAGPAVAGYLLEQASGKTFSEYLRDDVMRRMGMPTSDFDLPPGLEERLARSYEPDGSQTPYQYIILPPAGSLATSARELAQLVLFFIGRGTVDGHRLVSSEGVERIERSETTLASDAGFTGGYGLGNAPFPGDGLVFRGHNGGIDSFTSVFGYRVEGGLGFVLLANGGDGVNFDSATTELVKSYLLRHSELKAPTTVSVSANELSRYAGFYRTVTPPNSLTEPYADLLSFSRVSAAGDHLVVSGKDYFPVGPHSFRRADRDAPSLGFVYADDGVYKIGPFSSQVRQPIWRVAVLWLACGLLIVGLLLSIVMLPVWLIGALRGRLERRGGAAVRFVPVLGYAALIATFALPLLQITSSGMQSLHRLAEVGPYSLTIFACSLLFPLCALLGVWLIWKRRDASRFARVYAIVACLGLLSAMLYAASIGWLGAMTWRM